MAKKVRLVDLPHRLEHGMPLRPDVPDIEMKRLGYHQLTGNYTTLITTTMHMGTHADAPIHINERGFSLPSQSPENPSMEYVHNKLLMNGIGQFENVGGDIDQVLGIRCTIVGFPPHVR